MFKWLFFPVNDISIAERKTKFELELKFSNYDIWIFRKHTHTQIYIVTNYIESAQYKHRTKLISELILIF